MPYIPNSDADQRKMLQAIGVDSIEDLFATIPEALRVHDPLDLPPALSEPELIRHLRELSEKNVPGDLSFLGGGIYNHFVPPVVWALTLRPEFATAYTPYQAEVAQGTLQMIYEFQTHICRLTGMDVANASLYDGASAMTEAAMLAINATGRNKIVISETVNPLYRDVLKTTFSGREFEIVTVPASDCLSDIGAITSACTGDTACVIMAQPNFFGYLEELEEVERAIHEVRGLFLQTFDPISLAILTTPADSNADIAVGEGQSLGIPMNFGGPLLGLFACRKEFIRKIPGRLAARTVDVDGKPGFVLTLQTREQHIRRDKATSNICTNQALCATAATIYLSLMGKHGLPKVARLATERAHQLARQIGTLDGYSVMQPAPFFKEFVVETPVPAREIIDRMHKKGIAAGIDLSAFFPSWKNRMLVAATEMVSIADCEKYVECLSEITGTAKTSEATV